MKLPRWATTLDVVAVVMALVAISVAIGGGFRIWIFDSRLSVTSWWRPALVSVLAIVIRHALIRQQPLPRRVARGVIEWWRAPDTKIVLPIHLATRIGVLVRRLSRGRHDRVPSRSGQPLEDLLE